MFQLWCLFAVRVLGACLSPRRCAWDLEVVSDKRMVGEFYWLMHADDGLSIATIYILCVICYYETTRKVVYAFDMEFILILHSSCAHGQH